MEKSKYPIYLVAYKNGIITKCKSANELGLYRRSVGSNYFELKHYPSKEEVQQLLESLKRETS